LRHTEEDEGEARTFKTVGTGRSKGAIYRNYMRFKNLCPIFQQRKSWLRDRRGVRVKRRCGGFHKNHKHGVVFTEPGKFKKKNQRTPIQGKNVMEGRQNLNPSEIMFKLLKNL